MRNERPARAWRRLAWFVVLWAAGVLAVAAVGYVIKSVLSG